MHILLERELVVDRLLCALLEVVAVLPDRSNGIRATVFAYVASIPPNLQTRLCIFCSASIADVVEPWLDLFASLHLVSRISKLFCSYCTYQCETVLQCCRHLDPKVVDALFLSVFLWRDDAADVCVGAEHSISQHLSVEKVVVLVVGGGDDLLSAPSKINSRERYRIFLSTTYKGFLNNYS